MVKIDLNQHFSTKKCILLGVAHPNPTRPTSRPGLAQAWGPAEYCFFGWVDCEVSTKRFLKTIASSSSSSFMKNTRDSPRSANRV